MSIVTYNNRSIANISAVPGAAKSLTLIKTLTASSSSDLSFVNGSSDVVLDSTYPIYVFKFTNIHPATNDADFGFNMTTDGTNFNVTKTGTNFRAYHNEGDSSTAVNYHGDDDIAQGTGDHHISYSLGSDNDQGTDGTLHLFNPSSTTFVKHYMSRFSIAHSSDFAIDYNVAGYGNTTSAVTGCRFKMSSGNIDAGTIKLYGIKDS
jgi:hypothetical protein